MRFDTHTHTFEIIVVSCVVVGCTSRCVDGSLSFHRIPKEEKRSDVNMFVIPEPCNSSRPAKPA